MNSFFIYIGVKPTVLQLLYGSYPPILAIDSLKISKQHTKKQNLSKTEQSVVICRFQMLLEPQKFQNKFMDVRNLSINHLKKELTKYDSPIKMASILASAKVSVFCSRIKKTFPKSSQRFYLAQTLIKHKKTQPKQRLNNLFITKQEQKARNK